MTHFWLSLLPWSSTAPGWPALLVLTASAGLGITLLLRAQTLLRRSLAAATWFVLFILLLMAHDGALPADVWLPSTLTGDVPTSLLIIFGSVLIGVGAWICTDAVAIVETRRIWVSPLLFALLAGVIGLCSAGDLLSLLIWNFVVGAASLALVLLLFQERGHAEPVRALVTLEAIGLVGAVLALGLVAEGLPVLLETSQSTSAPSATLSVGLALLLITLTARVLSLLMAVGLISSQRQVAISAELALGGMALPAVLFVFTAIIVRVETALPLGFGAVLTVLGTLLLLGGGFIVMGARTRGLRVAAVATSLVGLGLLGATVGASALPEWMRLYAVLWFAPFSAFLVASSVLERLGGWSAVGPDGAHSFLSILVRPALLISILAISGLPPFFGFWPRLILIENAWIEARYLVLGVIMAGSLLLLAAFARRMVDPPSSQGGSAKGIGVPAVRSDIAVPELVVLGLACGLSVASSFYPRPVMEWHIVAPTIDVVPMNLPHRGFNGGRE